MDGKLTPNDGDDDKSSVDPDDVKVDMEGDKSDQDMEKSPTKDDDHLFAKRRKWAKNIQIYRLVNGKFQPKDYDEEMKKQQ